MNRRTIQKALLRLLIAAILLSSAALSVCAADGDTLFSADYELYKGDTGESGTGAETGRLTVSSKTPEDFRGKKIGVATGATTGPLTQEYYDGEIEIVYFDSPSDTIEALKSGKIDAYVYDNIGAVSQLAQDDRLALVYPYLDTYGIKAFFPKDKEKSALLCEQFNAFLEEHRDETDAIFLAYLNGEEEPLDMSFTGENGTVSMAVCSMGRPYCYYTDNELNGYELYLACEFAKEYGYELEFVDYNFAGMLTAVSSGKCDMGASATQSTYEREESIDFSNGDYALHHVLITLADTEGSHAFLAKIANSFSKTFLVESRWRFFVTGIANTLLITVLSAILGTLLGYLLYLLYASGRTVPKKITDLLEWLIRGMPTVVLLMILYYIVFNGVNIAGVWVAVIAFTLTFAVAMMGMIKAGVAAVDKGQSEGATALGYTKRQCFRYIVFPQAVNHFMPIYCAELVTLIKATAVVGFIAVQDITRISDIIRSMTFEAFFPLIVAAILYFVLGAVLTAVVRAVEKRLDNRQRAKERILKGVTTHD